MLDYYGLEDHYRTIKEWYNGYRFGTSDVYCPWDVINYVDELQGQPGRPPQSLLDQFQRQYHPPYAASESDASDPDGTGPSGKRKPCHEKINEELTYRELYDSLDNLWSVLFTTGYLTRQAEVGLNTYELIIPNREIRMIFTEQILDWFQKEAREDAPALDAFCEAFRQGDPASIKHQFASYLKKTISIRGTAVRKERKENFYHGILLGLLSHREDWLLLSNAESGAGYSDILIEIPDENTGIVIELKYSESRNMEAACQKALEQIEEKNYAEHLMEDGMDTIFKYGIACRRNACTVRMAE